MEKETNARKHQKTGSSDEDWCRLLGIVDAMCNDQVKEIVGTTWNND